MTFTADSDLCARVTKILLDLGFPASYRGYEYLRRAIIEAYYRPESTKYVTKALYPKVARLCGCSCAENVARGCRHAIEYACDHGILREYYTPTKSKPYPPSRLVISGIADFLRNYQQ